MNYIDQYSDRYRFVPGTLTVVTILALAAAVLYGTADFLGGVASRRASVFAVLATTVPAGAAVVIVVALLGEAPGLGGLLGARPGLAHLVRRLGRGRLGGRVRHLRRGRPDRVLRRLRRRADQRRGPGRRARLHGAAGRRRDRRRRASHRPDGRRRPDLPGRHRPGQHAGGRAGTGQKQQDGPNAGARPARRCAAWPTAPPRGPGSACSSCA